MSFHVSLVSLSFTDGPCADEQDLCEMCALHYRLDLASADDSGCVIDDDHQQDGYHCLRYVDDRIEYAQDDGDHQPSVWSAELLDLCLYYHPDDLVQLEQTKAIDHAGGMLAVSSRRASIFPRLWDRWQLFIMSDPSVGRGFEWNL